MSLLVSPTCAEIKISRLLAPFFGGLRAADFYFIWATSF